MHILFVCTGNICRSAVAERLVRAFADDLPGLQAGQLTATSAGTDALVGRGVDPSSAQVLRGLGGDPAGFQARRLTSGLIDEVDLVLTMTRAHRRKVLELSPGALSRSFTLLEAAELLEGVSSEDLPSESDLDLRGRELVRALNRQRAVRRLPESEGDDVLDPIGQSTSVHLAVGDVIAAALIPLLSEFIGGREAPVITTDLRRAG